MSRSDGKRPDDLTLVAWKEDKPLTWDSTVVCTVADSYVKRFRQRGEDDGTG